MNFPKILVAWCDRSLAQILLSEQQISSVAVVTVDGFVVSHLQSDYEKASRIAAMASSLFALSDAAVTEEGIGPYKHLLIDAERGKIVVTAFSLREHPLLLVQIGGEKALLGGLIVNARFLADKAQVVQM